jgi:hypothetical protein
LYWGGYLPYVNVVADQYQPNGLMGSSTRGRFTVHLHRIR